MCSERFIDSTARQASSMPPKDPAIDACSPNHLLRDLSRPARKAVSWEFLPGTIGSIQATEALKMLLGIGSSLVGRLLLYNALDMSFEFVTLRKNPKCRVCGPEADIKELIDYDEFCGVPGREVHDGSAGIEWDITPVELFDALKEFNPPLLIDVREPHEQQYRFAARCHQHAAGCDGFPPFRAGLSQGYGPFLQSRHPFLSST